jgi:glycosyltransferase involved in cell wall biosynthesis
MKQDTRVSVIIPAYNREGTIQYCLKSVIHQTLPPHEVLVVDDCSTDGTIETVEKLRSPLVRVVRLAKNSGAQAARNAGIKAAAGEWIAFQDSDDEWVPNKLELQIRCAADGRCQVVMSDGLVVNSGQTTRYSVSEFAADTYKRLLIGPGPMFQGLLVQKVCFQTSGYLDEQVPAFQEWDTCLSLARHFRFGYVNVPLYKYHLHGGETISKNVRRGARGVEYIVKKHASEIVRVAGCLAYLDNLARIARRYLEAGDHEKWAEYKLLHLQERKSQVSFYYLKTALIRLFPRFYSKLRSRYIKHKEVDALRRHARKQAPLLRIT